MTETAETKLTLAQEFKALRPLDMKDVIYEVHLYAPMKFTHQGVSQGCPCEPTRWPDAAKGWNREYLRSILAPVREFQLKYGARIYAGEFSAIAWADGAEKWLADAISVFGDYGWDWTYHAFREWNGWSVEHEGPDAQHMTPAADTPRKRALLDGFRGN